MNRESIIDRWLQSFFGASSFQRKALAGDASARRYYRIHHPDQSYVLMDAPPPEAPHRFVDCQALLAGAGLTVPHIIAADLDQGLLLLSDFGDDLYLQKLQDHSADHLYEKAMVALIALQQCTAPLAHFDRAFMHQQLNDLFEHWYLKHHKSFFLTPALSSDLQAVYRVLFENARQQPQVVIHRDYHSRNLMVLSENSPGILDFQDAMRGPLTYDLVSLLQDCYIDWPADRIQNWVRAFQVRAEQAGLVGCVSDVQFLRWFHLSGVQRHLKNLGIFARLHHRDRKSTYLKEIPRVLGYIQETCALYAELEPLGFLLHAITEDSNSQNQAVPLVALR
ncbi:MAG: phosphotransferase [Gammaproteobacteria bacterium]|nr:phosphotransferase [Gammaproteobacteria bacterium]MBP9729727.1 phosphotransferase [Gammaproteobacteria bacterium]